MEVLYTALKHTHSGLRWVVLILLVLSIVKAFRKRSEGVAFPGKEPIFLGALISTHLQLILGLILYFFLSPYVRFEGGMETIMGDAVTRFYTVEHIFGMLVSIILITIGYSRSKRQAPLNKGWKTVAVFYTLGLVVMLLSIPWPFRNLGAGWF